MKEKLVQFGDEGRLSGIVSLPAKDSGEGKVLPVVIILSAGDRAPGWSEQAACEISPCDGRSWLLRAAL